MTTTFESGRLYGTIWSRNATRGTVEIIKAENGTFTVLHSDLYREYSRIEGFKSFRKAKAEAACYAA